MKSLTQAPHGVNTSATSSSYREWDKVTWLPYNEGLVAQWCLHKPGITPDSFKRAGGRLGRKPDKTNIVALPVFGPLLTEQDPIGWVEWRRDGLDIITADGEAVKMKSMAGTKKGLMGLEAIQQLKRAEVIWKVEGPGDMMALASMIPEELRGKHVVITNSDGCNGNSVPEQIEHLAGKIVYVLHDADRPGQGTHSLNPGGGAIKWSRAIALVASECRNVQLPYEVAEKHGKDARDFINEGGTYQQLLEMAAKAPIVVAAPKPQPAPRRESKQTAANYTKSELVDWDSYAKSILDGLDIHAEYTAMGVEITGRKVNGKGWIGCRAAGRVDQNPSGEINIGTGPGRGRYADWVTGENLSLFDFAAKFGNKGDWKDARRYFAGRAGVSLRKSKIDKLMDGLRPFLESPPEPTPQPPHTPEEARARIEAIKSDREAEAARLAARHEVEIKAVVAGMHGNLPNSCESPPETHYRAQPQETPSSPTAATTSVKKTAKNKRPTRKGVPKALRTSRLFFAPNLDEIFSKSKESKDYYCSRPRPRLYQERTLPVGFGVYSFGRIIKNVIYCRTCTGCRERFRRGWAESLIKTMQFRDGKQEYKYPPGQRFYFAFVPKETRSSLMERLSRDKGIVNRVVIELPGDSMLVIADGPWSRNHGGRRVPAKSCSVSEAIGKVVASIAKMELSQFVKKQPIKASPAWRKLKPEPKDLVLLGVPTKNTPKNQDLARYLGAGDDYEERLCRGVFGQHIGMKTCPVRKPDEEILDLLGVVPVSKMNLRRKAKAKTTPPTPLPPPKSIICYHAATFIRDGKKYCLNCESLLGYNHEHPNLFSTNIARKPQDAGTHAEAETDSSLSC